MWIIFGVGAIITAILNVVKTLQTKDAKWFRFISMSLTALTLCAFYHDGAAEVIVEDWAALQDIMPAVSKPLWICTFASIIINSISLFKEKK